MYARRIISVLMAALAIAVCVFITYISGDVDTSSLVINLTFLGVMLFAILTAVFTSLRRLSGISKSLAHATAMIRTAGSASTADSGAPDTVIQPQNGLFQNKFLDDSYAEYCDMVRRHPDGSCDISDFINEDAIETHIHLSLLELLAYILTSLGILGTFIGLVPGLR
ncbi:MAG: hypothetical protein LIO94_12070, partial [Clostridiales bacterium]|nr:hypothetical protein [Clostridiales bacterium]